MPPEAIGAASTIGLVLAALGVVKVIAEIQQVRAMHTKTLIETETAATLGVKAFQEAERAGVIEMAGILAELRKEVQSQRQALSVLRTDLEEEREHARIFRGAVLEFIGVVSNTLPAMSLSVRTTIQEALERLRNAPGWGK